MGTLLVSGRQHLGWTKDCLTPKLLLLITRRRLRAISLRNTKIFWLVVKQEAEETQPSFSVGLWRGVVSDAGHCHFGWVWVLTPRVDVSWKQELKTSMSECSAMGSSRYALPCIFPAQQNTQVEKVSTDRTGKGKRRVGLLAPELYTVCYSVSILVFW